MMEIESPCPWMPQPWQARKKPLTIEKILPGPTAHHYRTGLWPSRHSGLVRGVAGETWDGINARSGNGGRGLAAAPPCRGCWPGTEARGRRSTPTSVDDQTNPGLGRRASRANGALARRELRAIPARRRRIGTTYKEPCTLECEAFPAAPVSRSFCTVSRRVGRGSNLAADDQTDPGLGRRSSQAVLASGRARTQAPSSANEPKGGI